MAVLTISNPSLKTGDVLSFTFSGMLGFEDVWVGVVGGGGLYITADASGHGGGSFAIGEGPGTYTLEAYDSVGHYATASFTVTAVTGTWTLLNTVSTYASHRVTVAALTCTASLLSGGSLSFSFTGFTPNAQVWVGVVGGGGVYVYASSLGAGSGSFVDGDPAGSYTLRASDNYGKIATATFTVTAVQIGWVLLSTVNTVANHGVVLTGWKLLSTVSVPVIHSANLLGWVLLNAVNVQAVHTANLLGWQLLSTVNAMAVHTANLLGWVLLSTVNTTAVHKTGEGPTPPPPTTPSWLVPAAIVAVALASQQSTKKVGAR